MKYAPATMPRIKISKKDIEPYHPDIINEMIRYAQPCQMEETEEYWALNPIIKGEGNRPMKGSERERIYLAWIDMNLQRIRSFGLTCELLY